MAKPPPPHRSLRVYTFDPGIATRLDTALINQMVLRIPWEDDLRPGPVGDYLEVIDVDPASNCFYDPVNLNDPYLLAQDGLTPSEGSPRFHQQMAYAVAMTTIANFERALGRRALWAPHVKRDKETREFIRSEPVFRLRVYPHALREQNAYYSPEKKALLFGYFPTSLEDSDEGLPGGLVFTCLSQDVVAHETTHALLDGLHRYFAEPSNPDVFGFHEGFADITALFQHYSHPESLRHEIAKTRGQLRERNLLGEVAHQFGDAAGNHAALRDYIGKYNEETKQWEPREPDRSDYSLATDPHDLGAVLVASLYDAFLSIYEKRTEDLFRIATEGRGVLPKGQIHPDLVNRLAREASSTASHFLQVAIRALDYCPPVDISFAEYLRALVTSDYDVTGDDAPEYRIAVIEAFRRRGIYSHDVRVLGEDILRWQPPEEGELPDFARLIYHLKKPLTRSEASRLPDEFREYDRLQTLEWMTGAPRPVLDLWQDVYRMRTWRWMYGIPQLTDLKKPKKSVDASAPQPVKSYPRPADYAPALGLELGPQAPGSIFRASRFYKKKDGRVPTLEVHSVRVARRRGAGAITRTDLVIEMTQRRRGYFESTKQAAIDSVRDDDKFLDPKSDHWKTKDRPDFIFRGGCTLLIDGETGKARYCIRKDILSSLERKGLEDDGTSRLARQREFALTYLTPSLRETYDSDAGAEAIREPFAMLHRSL
jgi:hypothetical protein